MRIRRVVFCFIAIVSLLLGAALALGWSKSYTITSGIIWSDDGKTEYSVIEASGRVAAEQSRINPRRGTFYKQFNIVTGTKTNVDTDLLACSKQRWASNDFAFYRSGDRNTPFTVRAITFPIWAAEVPLSIFPFCWLMIFSVASSRRGRNGKGRGFHIEGLSREPSPL